MQSQLVLENVRAFSSKGVFFGNVGISHNRISALSASKIAATKSIDCEGKALLPGLIDAHVHFRVPGGEHKEDWRTGSLAALAGGITTVLDMPNTNPATTTRKLLEEKRAIASRDSLCNFGFHFGATNNNIDEILAVKGISSVKVFMGSSTGDLLVTDKKKLLEIFSAAKKIGKPVTVHAELEEAIQKNIAKAKKKKWDSAVFHSCIRSSSAEKRAIAIALKLQEKIGNRLHVCHVSTKEGIALIAEAKKKGQAVSCEVTPHHLFLTEKDTETLGNFGKMNPPLRSKKDADALWKAIERGTVDCIATDHAPHTIEEKKKGYWQAPSGVPGVETMLPLVLNAVSEKRLSVERVVELCCENPARIFGYNTKGKIAVGFDADLALVDLDAESIIKNETVKSKCKWSPFDGMQLKGKVLKTVVQGKVFDFG